MLTVRFKRATDSILVTFAVLSVIGMSLGAGIAQTPAANERRPASPRQASPEDELVAKMRAARSDPPQSVELIVSLVKQFPDSRMAESAGFNFSSALKKQAQLDKSPAKLKALADRFIAGTATAPTQLRARINSYAARAMLDNGLASEAATLLGQTVQLLDEQAYIAARKVQSTRDTETILKTNPKYKPKPLVDAELSIWFRQDVTSYYTLLGKAHLALNDLDASEAAFRKAYDLGHESPAAAGLATILEKRGKDADALEYMTEAVLSGRLDRAGLDQFRALYGRTHGGKLDGVEEYLDARYKRGYHNPIKSEKFSPRGPLPGRAVLAEFITGAGCIPCIPYDFTFESIIKDYSRRDLVLLVYHWHAPTIDPMGNRSSDARVIYYEANSAPTLFLDGEKFSLEERGDSRLRSAAVDSSQQVYTAVKAAIDKGVKAAPEARIKLTAGRVGKSVTATAVIDGLKGSSPEVTLHFALVEEEVHYSGENGLRFHPMVVRNVAKDKSWGYNFSAEPSERKSITHTFDLDAITAENLRYYDEWPVERNREVNARTGGEMDFDVGRFREQRHIINPEKLFVAAFLQDNKTRRVLQSTFIRVKGR